MTLRLGPVRAEWGEQGRVGPVRAEWGGEGLDIYWDSIK